MRRPVPAIPLTRVAEAMRGECAERKIWVVPGRSQGTTDDEIFEETSEIHEMKSM